PGPVLVPAALNMCSVWAARERLLWLSSAPSVSSPSWKRVRRSPHFTKSPLVPISEANAVPTTGVGILAVPERSSFSGPVHRPALVPLRLNGRRLTARDRHARRVRLLGRRGRSAPV